jgi:hypothetical protein
MRKVVLKLTICPFDIKIHGLPFMSDSICFTMIIAGRNINIVCSQKPTLCFRKIFTTEN